MKHGCQRQRDQNCAGVRPCTEGRGERGIGEKTKAQRKQLGNIATGRAQRNGHDTRHGIGIARQAENLGRTAKDDRGEQRGDHRIGHEQQQREARLPGPQRADHLPGTARAQRDTKH